MLRDQGYRASASRGGVPVYGPAFAGTKLYCLVTEAHGCEYLAKVVTRQRGGRESNSRPLSH